MRKPTAIPLDINEERDLLALRAQLSHNMSLMDGTVIQLEIEKQNVTAMINDAEALYKLNVKIRHNAEALFLFSIVFLIAAIAALIITITP